MYTCLNLSGADASCSPLVKLTWDSVQKSRRQCSKTLQGELTIYKCLGQQITVKICIQPPNILEEKLGGFFGKLGHSQASTHIVYLRKSHAYTGQDTHT